MKEIITPYLFENSLIISLSKDWISQFNKIPQFTIRINSKNKLVIESLEGVVSK